MCDIVVTTCRRSEIIRDLDRRYPRLGEHGALRAVVEAVSALRIIGLDGVEDADRLVAIVAERRIRQQLGLDSVDAQLDPQRRAARSSFVPG